MKFKNFYFAENLKVGDEVVYNKQKYVIKGVDGDDIELIDTSKTRGDTIKVDKGEIHTVQLGLPGIGGERAPKHRKRKTRSDIGSKRPKDDSEQTSLF